MNSNIKIKDIALVLYGHSYGFFSHGVYTCHEISKEYNIVLLVEESYKDNKKFKELLNIINLHDVIYYASDKYNPNIIEGFFNRLNFFRSFHQQYSFTKLVKNTLSNYNAKLLLQHDYIDIENMYFFHYARLFYPSILKISILSMSPSNKLTQLGFLDNRLKRSLGLVGNFKILGHSIYYLLSFKKLVESFINNIIIPLFLIGRLPYFGLSITDNVDIKPKSNLFDYHLVYEEFEKNFYTDLLGDKSQVSRIQSPITSSGELNKKLFSYTEDKGISIFFSLTGLAGYEEDLLDRWIVLINILKRRYPGSHISIKFHPFYSDDLFEITKDYINSKCSEINFLRHGYSISAEEIILNSWLIIGDVSSILPWAMYCPNKTVLSMDIETDINSRDMHHFENIKVFSKNSDFEEQLNEIESINKITNNKKNTPTLTDFISKLL